MKIVIFWEQEEYGGTDTHLLELLLNWPNKKDQIVVLSNFQNSGLSRIEKKLLRKKNIKINKFNSFSYNVIMNSLNFKLFKYFIYFFQPLLFLINLKLIYNLLIQYKSYDLILSNNGGYPGSWNCLCSIIASKKLQISNRFLLIHHEAERYPFLMRLFNIYVDKLVSNSITKIICVSHATKKTLIKNRTLRLSKKKYEVIYNTISNYIISKKKINFRKKYKLKKNIKLIGLLSRIEKYKGHEDLILSLTKLPRKIQDKIKVIIIGSGKKIFVQKLKDMVKNLNLERVVFFTGFLKNNSSEIINSLDLIINPTRTFEGYGLTVLEAVLNKKPVISTNVGAIKEVFKKKYVSLIPPNRPDLISKEIKNFILFNDEFKKKSKKAKSFFSKINQKQMSNNYRKFFLKNYEKKN